MQLDSQFLDGRQKDFKSPCRFAVFLTAKQGVRSFQHIGQILDRNVLSYTCFA